MRLSSIRFFHSTPRQLRRWTENCDAQLRQDYAKYGPAWAVISANQPSKRNLKECRRRWLHLSGVLDAEKGESERNLWLDGYERVTDSQGECNWIKIPEEPLPQSPLDCLKSQLPIFQANWQRKAAGWSEMERLTLREGFEQFVLPLQNRQAPDEEITEAWDAIARSFNRRTGTQCRNYFEKQFMLWNRKDKISKIIANHDGSE